MSVFVDDICRDVTGHLDVVVTIPQYVWRNPNNPQRDSNDQYHRAAEREVHNQNRRRKYAEAAALPTVCRRRVGKSMDLPALIHLGRLVGSASQPSGQQTAGDLFRGQRKASVVSPFPVDVEETLTAAFVTESQLLNDA